MVTLTDTAVFNPDCIAEQKLWAAIGLEMRDKSGGIAIFQAAVGGLITEWGHQWAAVLDQITATSKYEVRDILDVTKRSLNSSKVEPKTWNLAFGVDLRFLLGNFTINLPLLLIDVRQYKREEHVGGRPYAACPPLIGSVSPHSKASVLEADHS
ncbi:hypothetical protein FPCIR_13859 [Fusarium pseudocircinatum]|uniref:Uncharacterized protein n=1 Tax=Fusarium pseudocircinatum TaxID=56676 RepID=A0A8H5KGC4_9HYPO|nr:hypothetical protein FPCIR_13859 [Fusarium pseudocircinatum]